jgi:large subunit ribosomal protein L22
LNDLGRQISQKPIDWALLQMQFSEKRASTRIRSMLVVAKQHAVKYKKLDQDKLIVGAPASPSLARRGTRLTMLVTAEAWVTKGPRTHKRLDIKGRGKHGIRVHPDARLHVVLKEGATWEEQAASERAYKLARVRAAGLNREDRPIRNPAPMWAW